MSSRFNEKSEEEKDKIRKKISESQKARLAKRSEEDKLKRAQQQRDYMNNRTEEQKQQAINKYKETMSKKSEEELKRIYKKQSDSCRKTWANKNEEEMKLWSEKQRNVKNNYSEEKKKEIANKKKEFWRKYLSNMTPEQREEFNDVRKSGFLRFWSGLSEYEKQQWRVDNRNRNIERYSKYTTEDHINHSNRCKYAYELMSSEQKELIKLHRNQTYKRNNSYGKSSIEDNIYNCMKFKLDSITRQALLNGYKYDFLIVHKDVSTYIEINGKFWHNYKPFVNCEEHINEYNYLKSLDNRRSHIADIWRYDDVNKYNYCVNNNINLIRVYIGRKYNLNKVVDDIIQNLSNGQITLSY